MRKSRALAVVAAGASLALVATACSSGSTSVNQPGQSNSTGGSGGSNGVLPLNTNPGSGNPVKGGTLHMLGTGDVDYMDPNIVYYTIGGLGLRMWSRQLLSFPATPDKTTQPAADLATQVPSESNGGISSDGKTIKLTIRKGAQWDTSPARQVTAADVVRGVKRTCNPAQPFGGLPDFQSLLVGFSSFCDGFAKVDPKSATAIAKYQDSHNFDGVSVDPSNPLTVVFKLTHPAAYFVSMLTMPAFTPAPKEYDKYIPASSEQAQNTVADGPYKITKYSPTKEIDFARNPAWKASTDPIRKAYVDNIVVTETGDQNAIQQQLQANTSGADMEFDSFPPNNVVPQLIARHDSNLNLQPTFSSNPYVVFNTVSPNNNGALKKAAVRQAISRAINRDHLIQDASGPQVSPPLTHILPAGLSGTKSNTSPNPFPYDLSKAKSDLKAAGASNLSLKFLYRPSSSVSKSMFTTLQQDLSKAGIKITGVPVPSADFYTKYLEVPQVAKKGTWDVSLAGWGPDWYGDAAKSYFAPLFYGNDGKSGSAYPPNGSDFGFYNDPKVNSLIDQADQAATSDQSSKLWAQADQQVTQDAAIYPITANNQPTYHASHVHNTVFVPAIQQIDPTNVWLSKS